MPYRSNRSILRKADLALADLTNGGGYLKPEQAQKFIRLLTKQSVLLGLATVVPMGAPKKEIPKIGLTGRVLRPGQERTRLTEAQRVAPSVSMIELDAKLFKAQVDLSDEVLEDNIEKGDLRQTVMQLVSEGVARDMEDIALNGDTASTDPTLAQLNGLFRQATSHVVDAGGGTVSNALLQSLLISMPSEYLRDLSVMRYLTSMRTYLGYRGMLSGRPTAVGDKFLEQDVEPSYAGVLLKGIPLIPENMGTTANRTAMLLTHPKNVNVGIYRQVRVESDRDIEAGVLKTVVTVRFDVRFGDENAVAKGINILV